jgi:AcrR family transcriptional regulator
VEKLITDKARELFSMYGLKSVSMDDLAKTAGISKKTIYQYFSDKTQLVDTVVDTMIHSNQDRFLTCNNTARDAIDEVVKQTKTASITLSTIRLRFFHELERSFPLAWKRVVQYKQKTILPVIIRNLNRGIAENLYRPDINVPFVAEIRLQQLITALNPESFTDRKTDFFQLMNDLTAFYLHGIATEKGKKIISNYIKKDEYEPAK